MTMHVRRRDYAGAVTFPLALERKDNDAVIEQITQEIKSFGSDVKGLRESMQRDIAEVRRVADEAKAAASNADFREKLDAFSRSAVEKYAAIDKAVAEIKAQAEQVETALKRAPIPDPEEKKTGVDDALRFFEVKSSIAGNLKHGSRPTAQTVDIDGYKAWEAAYETYLRANDERMVEAKALSVGSNPDGGYLVPTARSARIIQRIYETSPIRRLATVETIGTSELELPIDVDDLDSGWVGETQDRPPTATPQVGVQKIPVHEIYANPRATQKFLEDAAINVEGWLADKVSDRFARVEATGFISGNGVNKPRGILSYPAGTGRDKLPQMLSGHATSITADAIVRMPLEIKSAYLTNATWLMKRSTVQEVLVLKDGQGQYLWRPSLTAGHPSILAGYPVEMADDMPAVQAGTLSIAFGDFRRGYTVVDRLGITTLRNPYKQPPFVEFYSRKRVGGAVVDFDAIVLMKVAAP